MSQIGLFDLTPAAPEKPGKKPENIVIWDIETQSTIKDVGGLNKLRISGAVAYSSADGKYYRYTESNIQELVKLLQTATLSIGFNTLGFDIPVLNNYTLPGALDGIKQLDLMDVIYKKYNFRVGLGNIASATLGVGKSADGLQAIEWFKNGQIDLMLDYCEQDVKVTKEVYEFGKKNGFVYFTPKGSLDKKDLKVSW